jgi:hypothetical protein
MCDKVPAYWRKHLVFLPIVLSFLVAVAALALLEYPKEADLN